MIRRPPRSTLFPTRRSSDLPAHACNERCRSAKQDLLHPKKVGTLPIEDKGKEEVKRTNEIKTAIPLLEAIDIEGKDVSGDALLTQRELATYLVEKRKAHYYFTVKGNQPDRKSTRLNSSHGYISYAVFC